MIKSKSKNISHISKIVLSLAIAGIAYFVTVNFSAPLVDIYFRHVKHPGKYGDMVIKGKEDFCIRYFSNECSYKGTDLNGTISCTDKTTLSLKLLDRPLDKDLVLIQENPLNWVLGYKKTVPNELYYEYQFTNSKTLTLSLKFSDKNPQKISRFLSGYCH